MIEAVDDHLEGGVERSGAAIGAGGYFEVRLNDIGEGVAANVPANTLDAAWLREALRG